MPWQGSKIAGMVVEQLGRDGALLQELARAVEIGQHPVEKRGPLDQTPRQPLPLVQRDE